jgi:hypothetical protein|tara:strand:- start:140 stop:643 length:504 start_codon:yes stop_codon:yes gene_type:complete
MATKPSIVRKILNKSIKSKIDKNGAAAELGFFNTTSSAAHPFTLNYTSSNIVKNTDVVSQRDFAGTFNNKTIRNAKPTFTNSDIQTFNLSVDSKQKVSTGSVSIRINGLEQVSSETQMITGSSADFYLSGSKNEFVNLLKNRQDHSGLTLDNLDKVIITYRTENVIG